MTTQGMGVPGAQVEALRQLVERVSAEALDRIWLFPPLVMGRKEQGVVAGGCFAGEDRRLVVTMAYRAEESGGGVSFHASFQEEGEAPDDRLARIMDGVVQRSKVGLGVPRAVSLAGSGAALASLVDELTPSDTRFPRTTPSTVTGSERRESQSPSETANP